MRRARARPRDRYGRSVAVCRVAGADLNAWMVEQGWAVAYRKYSTDYVSQETAAKAARRGLWRGEFVQPSRWRRGERLEAATASGAGDCRIKGNINRKGTRIYHVPGGASYAKTHCEGAMAGKHLRHQDLIQSNGLTSRGAGSAALALMRLFRVIEKLDGNAKFGG